MQTKARAGGFITLTLRDGDRILRRWQQPMHSFVVAWIQLLQVQMQQATVNIQDDTNTTRAVPVLASQLRVNSGVSDPSFGIVVGTGNTAVTMTDWKLAAKITHGVGAGQLQYGIQSFTTPSYDATKLYFVLTRNYDNGSGVTTTVKETGLMTTAVVSSISRYFMLVRDVLVSPVAVPSLRTLTVQYTLVFNT